MIEFGVFRGTNSPWFPVARHVRMEVFCGEQQIPPEWEMDVIDEYAVHWVAYRRWSSEDATTTTTTTTSSSTPANTTTTTIPAHDTVVVEGVGPVVPVATLRVFSADSTPAMAKPCPISSSSSSSPPSPSNTVVSALVFRMGRVAVRKCFRGTGEGRKLVLRAEQHLRDLLPKSSVFQQWYLPRDYVPVLPPAFTITTKTTATTTLNDNTTTPALVVNLHSQYDKLVFYQKAGYHADTDDQGQLLTFMEDGILHVNMNKILN